MTKIERSEADMADQNSSRYWTTPELAILQEHYTRGGITRCAELLPKRTDGAIQQMASKYSLRAPRSEYWRNSEWIDAQIRHCYTSFPKKGAVKELAIKIERPFWWVKKRAKYLGLVQARKKDLPWSDQELAILEDHEGKDPEVIRKKLKAKGFERTTTAIVIKTKRMGVSLRPQDFYSAAGFAKLMGVGGKTVTVWIHQGKLKATRRGTARTDIQGGDQWKITPEQARDFIIDYSAHVDIRKVEKYWFIDLLTETSRKKRAAA